MSIHEENILITWQCTNGHTNQAYTRHDCQNTFLEDVQSFIYDSTRLVDNPCTTCEKHGFYYIVWEIQYKMNEEN